MILTDNEMHQVRRSFDLILRTVDELEGTLQHE